MTGAVTRLPLRIARLIFGTRPAGTWNTRLPRVSGASDRLTVRSAKTVGDLRNRFREIRIFPVAVAVQEIEHFAPTTKRVPITARFGMDEK